MLQLCSVCLFSSRLRQGSVRAQTEGGKANGSSISRLESVLCLCRLPPLLASSKTRVCDSGAVHEIWRPPFAAKVCGGLKSCAYFPRRRKNLVDEFCRATQRQGALRSARERDTNALAHANQYACSPKNYVIRTVDPGRYCACGPLVLRQLRRRCRSLFRGTAECDHGSVAMASRR